MRSIVFALALALAVGAFSSLIVATMLARATATLDQLESSQ